MTQMIKKPSSPQPAKPTVSKLAADATQKVASTALAGVESTRNSAENAVKIGGKAVKDFMANSAEETQKAQEKVFAIGRESADHFAKSADAVSKVLYDAVEMSRNNVETCIECANLSASLVKDMSAEMFEAANKSFSDNVEMSKDFFACRTLSDMFELHNRMVKNSIDSFFSQSLKLSEMMFEYSSEALEPLNERFAQSTDHLAKSLSSR